MTFFNVFFSAAISVTRCNALLLDSMIFCMWDTAILNNIWPQYWSRSLFRAWRRNSCRLVFSPKSLFNWYCFLTLGLAGMFLLEGTLPRCAGHHSFSLSSASLLVEMCQPKLLHFWKSATPGCWSLELNSRRQKILRSGAEVLPTASPRHWQYRMILVDLLAKQYFVYRLFINGLILLFDVTSKIECKPLCTFKSLVNDNTGKIVSGIRNLSIKL